MTRARWTAVPILLACSTLAVLSCGGGGSAELEANKAVVRDYLDVLFAQGRMDRWNEFFSETVRFNGREISVNEFASIVNGYRSAFPDLRPVVQDQIAEGDRVVTRIALEGTHRGPMLGVPATGAPVRFSAIHVDRFVDGRIVESWHQANMMGLTAMLRAAARSAGAATAADADDDAEDPPTSNP